MIMMICIVVDIRNAIMTISIHTIGNFKGVGYRPLAEIIISCGKS